MWGRGAAGGAGRGRAGGLADPEQRGPWREHSLVTLEKDGGTWAPGGSQEVCEQAAAATLGLPGPEPELEPALQRAERSGAVEHLDGAAGRGVCRPGRHSGRGRTVTGTAVGGGAGAEPCGTELVDPGPRLARQTRRGGQRHSALLRSAQAPPVPLPVLSKARCPACPACPAQATCPCCRGRLRGQRLLDSVRVDLSGRRARSSWCQNPTLPATVQFCPGPRPWVQTPPCA